MVGREEVDQAEVDQEVGEQEKGQEEGRGGRLARSQKNV
mgnify:FL=1